MEEIRDGDKIWNPRIKEWIDVSEIPEFGGMSPDKWKKNWPRRKAMIEKMQAQTAARLEKEKQDVKFITADEDNISED